LRTITLVLTAIFQLNLAFLPPPNLADNLWGCGTGIVMGRQPFLSLNQHCPLPRHWRKLKATMNGLALSFLHPAPDSWWKGCCSLYTGCSMLVPSA